MYRLIINDNTYEKNNLSALVRSVFEGLKVIEDLYDLGVIEDNWDALITHKKVEIKYPVGDHKISIQIARIVL